MESTSKANLLNRLKDHLKRIKNLPSGPLYQSINKYLAELHLESGDEGVAIYHFVESQAVSLRLRTVEQINRLSMKCLGKSVPEDCHKTALEKKLLMLGSCQQESNFDSMMERLKDLPTEWTVVQLTSGYSPRQHVGNPSEVHTPPCVHVSRLDLCAGRPYSLRVPCASRVASRSGNFLRDFLGELEYLKLQYSTMQRENFSRYHLNKMAANSRMQTAMAQIEMNWLQHWRCILVGQLADEQLKNKLEAGLEKIVSNIEKWKSSNTPGVHLLMQALMASYSLSEFEVRKVVSHVTGSDLKSAECKAVAKDICSLGSSFPEMSTAKRHPVILIVDDTLKRLPWESISVLNSHPVTRIHSLHFLHALYKVYEHRIGDGVVQGVDPSKGHYIVNPDNNLNHMEGRIKSAVTSRLPEWRGTFGVKPTPQQFGSALQESDIFAYFGHGSGVQYLGNRQIQRLQVNAVTLLFGCNSTGLTSFGGRVESWSTDQCYIMSCSPCVIATLWNVIDVEIDKVSTNLLHHWLPPTKEMRKIIEDNKQKQPLKTTGNKAKDVDFDLVKRTTSDWRQEPRLLEAMRHGRAASQLFMTSASLVAIGLPVGLASNT
ncbi:separin [Bacillus rossius redtenbacheri]|uniref:separin n=1 Tax=Bacillus rossius redtenbacheri TaxID=93214 RepID=UPI002FDE167C